MNRLLRVFIVISALLLLYIYLLVKINQLETKQRDLGLEIQALTGKINQLTLSSTPSPQSTRKAANSQNPTSPICAEAGKSKYIEVTINPDTPSPRCQKVKGGQYLKVTNNTDELATILIANKAISIRSRSSMSLDESFASYLESGVHFFDSKPYSMPELWLEK